jgi:hypothetical protein
MSILLISENTPQRSPVVFQFSEQKQVNIHLTLNRIPL